MKNDRGARAVPEARKIDTLDSLSGGGGLHSNRFLKLRGDVAEPGANKVYGTDANGVRGWKSDPVSSPTTPPAGLGIIDCGSAGSTYPPFGPLDCGTA